MELADMMVESILPQGINNIEHSARITLGLNCEEYCVFDTIYSRKKKQKQTTFGDIQDHTGLLPKIIDKTIHSMIDMNLIEIKEDHYMLNSGMVKTAFLSQDEMYEKEFIQFWKDDKGVNCWPGPRDITFEKFKLARKKYDLEFILKQKKDYFLFLTYETWRKPMQGAKFLNVKTGQVSEDWISQLPDHAIKEMKEQTISLEDKNKLYT